jgi:hypothetical protein
MTLDERIRDLEEQLVCAGASLNACLAFMANEMGWEEFRVEMLYFDDEPKRVASAENARKLRNFLAEMRKTRL